jgi:PAS domain S-box-containing protein
MLLRTDAAHQDMDAKLLAMRRALFNDDTLFRVLADTMPQMVWSTLPDGDHDYYNARWYEFTGVPEGSTDGEAWNGMFHPEDQDRAWATWRRSLETGEPYAIEYRLRHREGEYRWVIGRALPVRADDGTITRWVGTCTDVHDAKLQAAENELLLRELSHRIKNIFAVINGIIGLSAREQPEARDFAQALKDRIAALGRAHDLARPHSPDSLPESGMASLHMLLYALLAPYVAADDPRLSISGEDIPVDDRGATPVAMLVHELATNAAKYGALSVPEGRISITTSLSDGMLTLRWEERDGPALSGPPTRTGFGTRLADMSVRQQMGGTLTHDWRPEGLSVTMAVRALRLHRADS